MKSCRPPRAGRARAASSLQRLLRVGSYPTFMFALAADQRHTSNSLRLLRHQRGWSGIEIVQFSACQGDGLCLRSKERERGRQDAFADASARQGRHQAGSSSHQQLLAQSQAQQGSRLLSLLGFSWVTGPWGGA